MLGFGPIGSAPLGGSPEKQYRTILIGAGASAEAGVPTARPMAREIYKELTVERDIADAIRVAIGGLKHHRTKDPFG
jgi:hypothetical protein